MPDYTDDHKTAHDSVMVCAAELGLFGLYFWSLFLFPTVRDALGVASAAKVTEGEPIAPEETHFPQTAREVEVLDKGQINHLGRLMVLSLTGFLVAVVFLSRAYVMTFFLLGGMAEVVFQMALDPRDDWSPTAAGAYPDVCRCVDDLPAGGHVYPASSRQPDALMQVAERLRAASARTRE